MVLLILVALWIVVLAPAFIRSWMAKQPSQSIDSFHRQLHLLERTGPKIVAPAYRLETATGPDPSLGPSGLPTISSSPKRPNLVLLQPVGDHDDVAVGDEVVDGASGEHFRRVRSLPVADPAPSTVVPPLGRGEGATGYDVHEERRRQARRRRGDILLGVVAACVFSGVLGFVPALHGLWYVTIAALVVLVAYVAMMIYAASLETDRWHLPHDQTAPEGTGRHRGQFTDADHRPAHAAPATAVQYQLAAAGFPGAWDDDFDEDPSWTTGEGDEQEYRPRHAAAGG